MVDGNIEIYTSASFGEQKISKTILRGEMIGAVVDRERPWNSEGWAKRKTLLIQIDSNMYIDLQKVRTHNFRTDNSQIVRLKSSFSKILYLESIKPNPSLRN